MKKQGSLTFAAMSRRVALGQADEAEFRAIDRRGGEAAHRREREAALLLIDA